MYHFDLIIKLYVALCTISTLDTHHVEMIFIIFVNVMIQYNLRKVALMPNLQSFPISQPLQSYPVVNHTSSLSKYLQYLHV